MKIHRDLKVSQPTAWFMIHRIRENPAISVSVSRSNTQRRGSGTERIAGGYHRISTAATPTAPLTRKLGVTRPTRTPSRYRWRTGPPAPLRTLRENLPHPLHCPLLPRAHLVRVDLVPHRDLLDRLVAAQCLQRYLRFEPPCESPSFLNRVVGRFLSGRCGVLLSLTEQPPDDDTGESIGHDGKVSPRAEPFSSVQDLRNSDTVRILLLSRRPATDVSVFPPPNAQA